MQELAFRSALLYGGLLLSNAFGSVGSFQQVYTFHNSHVLSHSSWLPGSCQTWKGNVVSELGDGNSYLVLCYTPKN